MFDPLLAQQIEYEAEQDHRLVYQEGLPILWGEYRICVDNKRKDAGRDGARARRRHCQPGEPI
jgi:hypothetical protein